MVTKLNKNAILCVADDTVLNKVMSYFALSIMFLGILSLLYSLLTKHIVIENITYLLIFIASSFFMIWIIVYVLKLMMVRKLQIKNEEIILRRWENGLYPEKKAGGSLKIPKYLEEAIPIKEIDCILICKGKYILQQENKLNDTKILTQMHSAHPLFTSSKVPVLSVIEKNGSYHLINLKLYSLSKVKRWINVAMELDINVKLLDNIIEI